MVLKPLYRHYLRSYEQFQKKSDFKSDFQAKSGRKNRICYVIFEYTKIKKNDQKMEQQPQKVQEKRNSKNCVQTAQRPLFKDLWTIFEKTDFNDDFEAKSKRKNRIYQRIFEYTFQYIDKNL